jgi:hypothetical protein
VPHVHFLRAAKAALTYGQTQVSRSPVEGRAPDSPHDSVNAALPQLVSPLDLVQLEYISMQSLPPPMGCSSRAGPLGIAWVFGPGCSAEAGGGSTGAWGAGACAAAVGGATVAFGSTSLHPSIAQQRSAFAAKRAADRRECAIRFPASPLIHYCSRLNPNRGADSPLRSIQPARICRAGWRHHASETRALQHRWVGDVGGQSGC